MASREVKVQRLRYEIGLSKVERTAGALREMGYVSIARLLVEAVGDLKTAVIEEEQSAGNQEPWPGPSRASSDWSSGDVC